MGDGRSAVVHPGQQHCGAAPASSSLQNKLCVCVVGGRAREERMPKSLEPRRSQVSPKVTLTR